MEIKFEFVSKERRGIRNLCLAISFKEVADKKMQQMVLSKYIKELVRRLDLKKIHTIKQKREKNSFQYKLIFREKTVFDEESLLTYLEQMGFTQIQSLAEFNKIEEDTLRKITTDKQTNRTIEEQRSQFTAYKQLITSNDYQKLYAKLFAVRDEIEQLYYQTGEERVDLLNSLREIDFLLDNKNLFVTDYKLFYLISNKVKKRLVFYARYLENMRYGQ